MARSRQLKPDFFLNEDLAALPALTRLAFQGLWLLADREGRLEDRPSRIKAQLFPYHEADIGSILTELSPMWITRYKIVDNLSTELFTCGYIQIVNFKKHQHIHPDEKASIIPAPHVIPGDPRRSPGIMPCSPSPSPSPSPKQPLTDSPSAVDRSGELKTAIKNVADKRANALEEVKLLDIKMPHGGKKGVPVVDLEASYCEWALKEWPNMGEKIIRALKLRIKIKQDELHPKLRSA